MKSLTYIFLTFASLFCSAQYDILSYKDVLRRIETLQIKKHSFYDSGLFPSQRSWYRYKDPVEDNNIFVTASLAFILQQIQERMDKTDVLIENITNRSEPLFGKYANRNGEVTYNFWQTAGGDIPFPNGSKLLSRERHRLPDDYDDTAIIELVKNDKKSSDRVREKMKSYAFRDNRKTIQQAPNPYKKYTAYEVFFADRMDNQYDIVVMCNVLSFVFKNDYDLNEIDLETLSLIKQMIRDKAHFNSPEAIAPSYRTTTLILYHLARLSSFDSSGAIEELNEQLIADIKTAIKQTESEMEKVLLYTSMYRLGELPNTDLSIEDLEKEVYTFIFFQFKPTQLLGMMPVMKWKSEALNLALILEFISFNQAAKSN